MARQANPPWVETTRLNQVEAGRDRLELRQTAEQSVLTDFHLDQPGRFQRPAAVGEQMLVTLGSTLAESRRLGGRIPGLEPLGGWIREGKRSAEASSPWL